MPRPVRFLVKKRGDRRTGSPAWAVAGSLLIDGVLIAVGVWLTVVLMSTVVLPEWMVNHGYLQGRATVVGKSLGVSSEPGNLVYRPDIAILYEVDGEPYRATTYEIVREYSSGRAEKEHILDAFVVGQDYLCWYDPLDPTQVVLRRGYTWWMWSALLIPAVLLLLGGTLFIREMLRWNFSPERLSTRYVQGTSGLGVVAYRDGKIEFPTVPSDDNIVNSPGTKLAYRLPLEISGWSRFLGLLTIAIVWNALIIVFICFQFPDDVWEAWLVPLVCVPFLTLGGYLIYASVQAGRDMLGIAPTQLELSDHPLRPGRACRLALRQTGNLKLKGLTVELLCEEIAVYRQGTDTRIEKRTVARETLHSEERRTLDEGHPLEFELEFRLPVGAMHSFHGAHNAIEWKLLVIGSPAGRPTFVRSYPLVVCPPIRVTV